MLSRLITRREQFVVLIFAAAAIIGAAVLYLLDSRDAAPGNALVVDSRPETYGGAAKDEVISEGPDSVLQVDPVRDEVTISLVGAVGRPGVYTLDAGSRIQDLIRSAGGLLGSADTSDVTLAATLIDGTTLIIPREAVMAESGDATLLVRSKSADIGNIPAYTIRGWKTGPSQRGTAAPGASRGHIDLNRATQAELESLPGIGPKLAEEIIRYRTNARFTAVSDVMNVSGIGQKRYEAIANLVIVR